VFILYKNFKEKSKKTAERQAIERYADGGIFREKSKVILHIALCVGSIAAKCGFDFAVIVRVQFQLYSFAIHVESTGFHLKQHKIRSIEIKSIRIQAESC